MPEINLYCRGNPQLSAYEIFCLFATSYIPKQVTTNEKILDNCLFSASVRDITHF